MQRLQIAVILALFFLLPGEANAQTKPKANGSLSTVNDRLNCSLKIFIIRDAKALTVLRNEPNAIVFANASWSLNSQLTLKGIFENALNQSTSDAEQVSFFIITEPFFDNFLKFTSNTEGATTFNPGCRDRGAFLVKRNNNYTIVDPKDAGASTALEKWVSETQESMRLKQPETRK